MPTKKTAELDGRAGCGGRPLKGCQVTSEGSGGKRGLTPIVSASCAITNYREFWFLISELASWLIAAPDGKI